MSIVFWFGTAVVSDPMPARGDVNVAVNPNADLEKLVDGQKLKSEPEGKAASTEHIVEDESELREEGEQHMHSDQPKMVMTSSSSAAELLMQSMEVYREIARLVSQDPVILAVSLVAIAYVVAKMSLSRMQKPKVEAPKSRPPAPWQTQSPSERKMSWRSDRPERAERAERSERSDNWREQPRANTRPVKRGKSQIAIQVNQQLLRLDTSTEVLDCALAYTGQTDVVNIVTAIHRCAKLGGKNRRDAATDPRLVQLLDQLEEFLQQDQPISILSRAVGNTSWALAKMQFSCGTTCHPVLDTMQSLFCKHSKMFKPEELMNTVWAFAELRREAKEGSQRALEVAKAAVDYMDRFPEFTLQQVVYFTWALGRLSGITCVRVHPEVKVGLAQYTEKIVARLVDGIRSLTAKNLAMTAWGVAHLDLKLQSNADVKGLLGAIGDETVRRGLMTFSSGDLASIAWALNKSAIAHGEFYAKFRQHITVAGFEGYSSQDAANVISICVTRPESDRAFLQLLASAAEKFGPGFSRIERSMLHQAFSQVNHPMPTLGM